MPKTPEFPRRHKAVEKVGVGSVNGLESSTKRPKIGISGVQSGDQEQTRRSFSTAWPLLGIPLNRGNPHSSRGNPHSSSHPDKINCSVEYESSFRLSIFLQP